MEGGGGGGGGDGEGRRRRRRRRGGGGGGHMDMEGGGGGHMDMEGGGGYMRNVAVSGDPTNEATVGNAAFVTHSQQIRCANRHNGHLALTITI